MNKIVLRNQFYTYTMEVADDGHLKHCGFLPADIQPSDSSRELKRIYPYEVTLAFAESQCLGWRFADAMLFVVHHPHLEHCCTFPLYSRFIRVSGFLLVCKIHNILYVEDRLMTAL